MTTSVPETDSTRCTHLDAAGRRCRMLLTPGNPSFCASHATEAAQAAEAARLAAKQQSTRSLAEINAVLAELFSAVSQKKIDLRQGALLAYIAQLMIQTNKGSAAPLPNIAPTA